MIAFSCPRCKAFLTKEDKDAGSKLSCPSCGQRLQVPLSPVQQTALGEIVPPNRTILANVEPTESPPSVLPAGTGSRSLHSAVAAPNLVPVGDCPSCRRSLSVPAEQLRRWVTCPYCGVGFVALENGGRARRPVAYEAASRVDNGPCPECGSKEPPYHTSKMSQTGVIVMILFLLFFFPLFWIGLLMKEEYWVCPECGYRSGFRSTQPF